MIEFAGVTKQYGRGAPAVDDLSLVIPSSQTTVIVGPSGCGKTTTLRMINRMLEPTSGSVIWDDTPLTQIKKTVLRRQMGYVIQSGGLFPHRSVADNIATVPRLIGWDATKIRRRVGELMELTELAPELAARYPAELSGGQQQRVGVARALAADPHVLLMDEPFSAVDPVVRGGLQELVRGLQRDLRKTVVMITHDIDEAISMGDQVAILRRGGTLAQVGTPQELLEFPADDFVTSFVGRDRGYRSLGFTSSDGLRLAGVRTTRRPDSATFADPVIVLDETGRPVAWVDPERPGGTLPLGVTFDPARDSLRQALDAALSSSFGKAVAVTGEAGRYAGVVAADEVMRALAEHRQDVIGRRAVEEAAVEVAAVAEASAQVSAGSPMSPEYPDPPGEFEPGPAAELVDRTAADQREAG